jgi:hypothetical protein
MKIKTKYKITASILIVICAATAIGLTLYFTVGPGAAVPPPGTPPGTFSIVVYDGSRNERIALHDVHANLYLLPEDAVDTTGGDWSEFENQTHIDFMSDIDEADLKVANFIMAVVLYHAPAVDFEDSEGDVADADHDCVFYASEARLYAGKLNSLPLYEEMADGADPKCYNSDTMAVINTATTNLTSFPCVNFTFTISATNMSAHNHHQMYVAYWSYVTDDWAHLSLTLTFNTTCQKQELSVTGGLSVDRPSTTSLSYSWDYLDSLSIQTYHFNWHVNVTGTWPTSHDILVIHDTPPVLAFNGVAI